jgi:uncharacterized protein
LINFRYRNTIAMSFDQSFLWLPLVGFIIGLLVTMFGGGGGFFYIPILTLLFHLPIQLAVVASLATMIPTTIVGSIEHYKKGNINIKIGVIFGIAGLVGTLIGAYVSNLFSSVLLQRLFGIYAIALTIPMIITNRKKSKKLDSEDKQSHPLSVKKYFLSSFFGIISGIMAGLFGTSGTASIVAGLYILELPVTIVVGTSVLIVFFNAITGLTGHLIVGGPFNLLVILLLSGGAAIGAFLGPRLLVKINIQTLEKVYGVFFILLVISFGIIMLLK